MDKNLSKLSKFWWYQNKHSLLQCFTLDKFLFSAGKSTKNVLEWFPSIMCKEYTLTRFINLLSRNHPTLCFWWREGRQMPNTYANFIMIKSRSGRLQMFFKIGVLKNLAIFTRKQLQKTYELYQENFIRPRKKIL